MTIHPDLKKALKALSLELRHLLEGHYDAKGAWHAGDLEQRLNALGVWRDRAPLPADEMTYSSDADRRARALIDAYLALRGEAGIAQADAVAEFVRETAYTWANRLLALRCMEARGLIDEVILQKDVYGGRSLEHHRLAQRRPDLCMGADDGLLAVMEQAFARQAAHLPLLFDPQSPAVALTPSTAAIKQCVALLSAADAQIFQAADALGWAYQYWNTEEKDRVFAKVRTERGAKIAGADIIPATQLYTEPYMVQFLVQNSLGALWMGMHPASPLNEKWAYYVRDADRAPVEKKPLREVTFLDPACGSGHFLLEAFDLFYDMYEQEGELAGPAAICAAILEHNLYGIDIDERAVQIAETALWMKAAEKAFGFTGTCANLVATNIRLPRGQDHLRAFLAQHPEDGDLRPALEVIFEGLAHADELGSLLQLEEPVEKELRFLQAKMEERRGKPEQAVLFPDMEKPRQGELPLGVESYEAWKTRTLARLKRHFAAEAQAADLGQAFFGRSAHKGVRLFDLLAQRYDVVAANPPYMGSKNMGETLKRYLGNQYHNVKRDLYAVFILRCLQLVCVNGHVAMVTQQSWMFLNQFRKLREVILASTQIEFVVHLGRYAFSEIGNAAVQPVLSVMHNRVSNLGDSLFIRLHSPRSSNEQATMLQSAASGTLPQIVYRRSQHLFSGIEDSPLSYWLPLPILKNFSDGPLKNLLSAKVGIQTGNTTRFIRYYWEVTISEGWRPYTKGGRTERWCGVIDRSVRWWHHSFDVSPSFFASTPNTSLFSQKALTYTMAGNSIMAARLKPPGVVTDIKSPVIVPPKDNLMDVLSLLNSRVVTYLLRAITATIDFSPGYVEKCAGPFNDTNNHCVAEQALHTKCLIASSHITEMSFDIALLESAVNSKWWLISAGVLLAVLEGQNERNVFNRYSADAQFISDVVSETGMPVGWYPLIQDYDELFPIPGCFSELPQDILTSLSSHNHSNVSPQELLNIKSNLRVFYESGSGAQVDEDDLITDTDYEEDIIGAQSPVPPETFLEELSQKLQIHPISVYWLLKEGIEQEGWHCLPEERRLTADRFTVLILRLLGHRWPKQIAAGEPVPAWAEPDGIIPLTEGTQKSTLLEHVRERLAAEFAPHPGPLPNGAREIEREFQELMGESLEAWLGQTFFKHHTSQFKKRPVAWQLQSGRWTARQKPAFACLVYYHRLNGDTLITLQSQYVRPLRQRYEVELRGIESLPAAARSDRQAARRVELGDLIRELHDFDAALGRVAAEGFACPVLETLLAQEPLDRWCSADGVKAAPPDVAALRRQEQRYTPDLNDGVRVNIAPLQAAGLLAADVLAKKDLAPAIADRAEWRADERRWCREGKLPRPGWWE